MAGSVNKVILIGNLGRDPEVRSTQNGGKIVNLNVATSESWKDKSTGDRQEKTEWHRVVIFNDRVGEIAERYLKKGSKVYIEGALQTRKWTDKEGQERYSTEIVIGRFKGELTLLDSRGGGGDSGSEDRAPARSERPSGGDKGSSGGGPTWEAPADLDDEIPF
jgi:single-strand DNA-binding protein